MDPARDESLIFELLDLKTNVADEGSAVWFFQDLANEQEAEGVVVSSLSHIINKRFQYAFLCGYSQLCIIIYMQST